MSEGEREEGAPGERAGRDRTAEIARAIAASRGAAGLLEGFERLSPSELGSVLLHVFRRLTAGRTLAEEKTRGDAAMVAPSSVDARVMLELDRLAFEAASAFDAVELSPVSPLGLAASTGIDQNNVVSALRGAEVTADPTALAALECARRRRARGAVVRLASSHRVIRLQPIDVPGYSRHFRIFSLATAGRDTGDERFERAALREHLGVWLALLRALADHGYRLGGVRVEISDTRIVRALVASRGVDLEAISREVRGHAPASGDGIRARLGPLPDRVRDPARELAADPVIAPFVPRLAALAREVFAPLASEHPDVDFVIDLSRISALNYYAGPMLRVVVGEPDDPIAISDGGATTWTQQILSDRKERLFVSAIGSELLVKKYRGAETVPEVAPEAGAQVGVTRAPPRRGGLEVSTFVSGIWQLASVVLSSRGRAWVIDPGYFPRELEAIATRAAAAGEVEAVVFTHGHWDHVLGWRTFPRARVLASASLAEAVREDSPFARTNLADAREFDGRWYVDRGAPLGWPPRVEALAERERRTFGGVEVEALHLPGHSTDGLALRVRERGLLIAGDYLSPLEIPFVDDLARYRETLERLIALLPELDTVIPGHGPVLDRAAALAIARADRDYLDRLLEAASRGGRERANAVPLPRAAVVPGMREHHLENVEKALAPTEPAAR